MKSAFLVVHPHEVSQAVHPSSGQLDCLRFFVISAGILWDRRWRILQEIWNILIPDMNLILKKV